MNYKSDEFIENLPKWADEYMQECIDKTKEHATGSGKVVNVKERNIPTILYFLHIWLPIVKKRESCVTKTYYEWLKGNDEVKSNTIKTIDDKFKALAADIVANEGKGIFYAKNKLGWTDRTDLTNRHEGEIKITMDLGKDIPPPISPDEHIV